MTWAPIHHKMWQEAVRGLVDSPTCLFQHFNGVLESLSIPKATELK